MVRIFLDDIDGSEAAMTRTFAVDGVEYEIELSDLNDKKFKEALAIFVEHARPTGETAGAAEPVPTARASTPPTAVIKAVRQARKTAASKVAKRASRRVAPKKAAAPFVPDARPSLQDPAGSPAFTEPAGDLETIDGLDLDPEPDGTAVPVFAPQEEDAGDAGDDGAESGQPVQVSLQNDELTKAQRAEVRRWMARHSDPVYRAKASARGRLAQSIIDAYFQANPITVRLDFDTDD